MNLSKSNYQIHFYFFLLIVIDYLISIICFGQIILEPGDLLDSQVVTDHIISNIYKGDTASLNYFLSGEIKWYYLEQLFYPTNILHYVLDDKLFYFTNAILKRLLAYYFFYLLAKSLCISKFNSALGGVLYTILLSYDQKMQMGIAMPFLPYILYLLLNKDTLSKKHYFILFLVGLNSSLIYDIFALFFLIPLSFLLNNKNKNFSIYLQIFSVIFISATLSNIHVVIGSILFDPIHREAITIISNAGLPYIKVFQNFFTYIGSKSLDSKSIEFIFDIPLFILSAATIILSLFSRQKNLKLLIFFIIFILIIRLITEPDIINNIFSDILHILKGYNFGRVIKIIPITFTLLFVLFIANLKYKNLKKFLYFTFFLSILSLQLKAPLPIISNFFLKENMHIEKFEKTKKVFLEKKYIQFFKIIFDKKSYNSKKADLDNSINETFDNYYQFENYEFIRNIVKDSRVMSVGLDPMIAVMNDIKVIDGYHAIYPLSYKIKFRKIIESELEKNIYLKNYYDGYGSRVYAFYNDKNNIMLNFQSAKTLGADYVISKFPIKNDDLKIICNKCNNSSHIFLYKIL